MNEPRETAGSKVNLKRNLVVLAIGLTFWASTAAAQEKLGDIVQEAGFGWMVGRWVTTADDGQEIKLAYKWNLDQHLATVDFKLGEYAYHSMIFYVPAENKVVEVGVDSRGGTSKATWDIDGDKIVSKGDRTQPDGQTTKMAICHSRGKNKTMKMELYGIDSSGELAAEPWATFDFKRPAKKAGAKTSKPKLKTTHLIELDVEIAR